MIDDWLEIAYEDIEVAHLCYHQKYYLYMGFMCQQAIEKAIKAVIEGNNIIPKPIHNLEPLAKDANVWSLLNKEQKMLIRQLTSFAVAARYPRTREKIARSFTKKAAENILVKSKELLVWLCRVIREM